MKQKYNGRGVSLNIPNRFEKLEYDYDSPNSVFNTTFYKDFSKSIITYNSSPDIPINTFINPYRGCEHGCVYCYARPNHEYLGLSAGIDFETKIFVKDNAANLLRKELTSKKWMPQVIGISGVTDAYQPIEKSLKITRECLQILAEFRNPVVIITKNKLVTRDIDILKDMAHYNTCCVMISLTTLNYDLSKVMEPRTSRPKLRLHAIEELSKSGIPVGIIIGPVIPGLTDVEIPGIIKAAVKAGARTARFIMLRLPHSTKDIFTKWLEDNFPNHKDKVINRIKDIRGGKLYDSSFFKRDKGSGFFAGQIENLFKASCRKNGILGNKINLSTDFFKKQSSAQLELF